MNVITVAFLLLTSLTDPGKISKINSLKTEARKAFHAGDYATAIEKYQFLRDSLQVNEDEVTLNLANAYFQQSDTTNALSTYQQVVTSPTNSIRSKAHQQIGVLNNRQGKFDEALASFKQSIKADPNNMDARYNYEMLKKKLEEKKKQEEQQKKDQQQKDNPKDQQQQQDQQKKDEQQKKEQEQKDSEQKKSDNKDEQSKKEDQKKEDQKKSEQEKETEKPSDEKKETPPSVSEKLQQMKISEEKAKMLLEAMKNQEVQYLQQNKRKATKPKDKGKPDW